MSQNVFSVPIGDDADYLFTIYGANNQPIVYAGTEALQVQLWQGESMAQAGSWMSASWTNGAPATGVCVLSISGASTSGLTPDFFIWRLNVTNSSGRKYEAGDGWVRLTNAPGAATVPATYCSLQDLIDHGGEWITHQMMETSSASFLVERYKAKRWLDRLILARSRPYAYTLADYLVAGYSTANYAAELPDMYIASLLTGGKLIVTDDLKELCAYMTLHFICERSFTWGATEGDTFHLRANYYRAKATAMLASLVATFDPTGNPPTTSTIAINLGRFSIR